MGDGTDENPYTREDVIKKIGEMKNPYDWVDLSGGKFKYKIDLRGVNFHGFILKKADLSGANLEGVDLSFAKLEGANLSFTNLKGANLAFAHLEGADLFSIELSSETKLADVKWGNYILDEKEKWRLGPVENGYRRLKQWYTEHGMYDIAGQFFFREMTIKRKLLKWWPNPLNRALSKLVSILCGYGEKPSRVVISATLVVFGFAVAYLFGGLNLPYSIYFSAVSFTALGYGSWAYEPPVTWVQGVGAAESFIGVFMIALFLITFVRKMTR